MRAFEIGTALNKAKSLADFEQRAKFELSKFFNVVMVRVLFYDEANSEFLVSAAQGGASGGQARAAVSMRRNTKGRLSRFGTDKGIVGQALKKRQMIHVRRVLANPYVDQAVDGLDTANKPMNSESNMLVGLMTYEMEESDPQSTSTGRGRGGGDGDSKDSVGSSMVLGVVQLIERLEDKTIKGSVTRWEEEAAASSLKGSVAPGGLKDAVEAQHRPGKDFTLEEERLFEIVLLVCGSAAYRTLRMQQLASQKENGGGPQPTLSQILDS